MSHLTIPKLKIELKKRKIPFAKNAKKAELVSLLEKHESDSFVNLDTHLDSFTNLDTHLDSFANLGTQLDSFANLGTQLDPPTKLLCLEEFVAMNPNVKTIRLVSKKFNEFDFFLEKGIRIIIVDEKSGVHNVEH